jgi:hypothetical protein
MERAALERSRTVRVWREHVARHDHIGACICELQIGRFRKGQRVGGCGKPRCYACHAKKLTGLKTLRQLRALVRYREGMFEALASNSSFPRAAPRQLTQLVR